MDDYSINNIDYLIDLAVDYTTPEYHFVNEFLTNYESMEEDMISSLTALAKSAHEYVDDFSNVSDINKLSDDPFISGGLSGYPLTGFLPDDIQPYAGHFVYDRNDTIALSALGKAIAQTNNVTGLKYLGLLDLFWSNTNSIREAKYERQYDFSYFELYGDYLVADYYQTTDEYKESVEILKDLFSSEIKPVLGNMFDESSWLSAEGKRSVHEKLDYMKSSFLFESEGIEYDSVAEEKTVASEGLIKLSGTHKYSMLVDILNSHKNEQKVTLQRSLFYIMSPLTVNAAYLPTLNIFGVFLGFTLSKKPINQMSKEELLAQYGVVVGHEMTHGFDTTGYYFDKDGNMVSSTILPNEDRKQFNSLSRKLSTYYDSYELIPDLKQSGNQVIGEAIADQGGLNISLSIAKTIAGFDYKKFFTNFGQNFLNNYGCRDQMILYAVMDVHPFGKTRINNLLRNCPTFQEVFSTKENDGMYMPSDQMIRVW